MKAATIPVAIPMLLGNATSGAREVSVNGETLQECLDNLFLQYPMLRSHVYEERGQLRRHVLILFNDQNTRWLETLDVATKPGDRITIMQAVSGG